MTLSEFSALEFPKGYDCRDIDGLSTGIIEWFRDIFPKVTLLDEDIKKYIEESRDEYGQLFCFKGFWIELTEPTKKTMIKYYPEALI